MIKHSRTNRSSQSRLVAFPVPAVLLTLALAALPSIAVAGTTATIDAGRGEVSLTLPASYAKKSAAPLIVLLHGFGSSGSGQDEYLKLSPLVDDYGFILATPDGTASANDVFGMKKPRFWNASAACCGFGQAAVDDSAYLSGLIRAIGKKYRIDPKRIFLFGHSNGGFMSYRMAHDHSDTIAAIASLAGADRTSGESSPAHPVSVLQIHGTADETIAYAGGDIQGATYPGAKSSAANWAGNNGCSASGIDTGTLDLESTLAGAESTITRFANGCKPGGVVELWTLAEGSHIPQVSEHFSRLVVEWLLGHPKP